jgi:hypothetical protein
MFGIVMAANDRYADYARSAIASIRRYNPRVPIEVTLCGDNPALRDAAAWFGCDVRCEPFPVELAGTITPDVRSVVWTRFAKFACLRETTLDPCAYLDADVLALSDVAGLAKGGLPGADEVHMLLRRPVLPTIFRWRHAYLVDAQQLTPQAVADLLNAAFGVGLSVEAMLAIRCWNAGVIFGSRAAVRRLATTWRETYGRMVTGRYRERFVPKDQLCLWLAAGQPDAGLDLRELPLAWNFMPGHVVPDSQRRTWSAPLALAEVSARANILHFGHTKSEHWAVELLEQS